MADHSHKTPFIKHHSPYTYYATPFSINYLLLIVIFSYDIWDTIQVFEHFCIIRRKRKQHNANGKDNTLEKLM